MNALLVEDDADLGETLKQILEEEGFRVEWAQTGPEALYRADEFDFDLVILDRMLPELDGVEVLKRLRKTSEMPVLMLTALNEVEHRIDGLDAGADDYLGKPFDLTELLARVRALLRRGPRPIQELLRHNDVTLDLQTRQVRLRGEPVHLSKTEYQAVEYFLRHAGEVVTRSRLERMLYEDRDVSANPVDVLIHRIRAKLGKDFIRTRRGLGFLVGPQ